MPRHIVNMGASVRERLANLARERNQPFELLLSQFARERLLFRLGQSPHRPEFILKGAMLLGALVKAPFRPTRDIDFLGYGDPAPERVLRIFRDVCSTAAEDGVSFDIDALTAEPIRDHAEYGGIRIRTFAIIGGARVRILIDTGFGDAVVPEARQMRLPSMLGFEGPLLTVYPPEAMIAEKFHAMVHFGLANTRMKDFFDILILSRSELVREDDLGNAIAATFARRKTVVPRQVPPALTQEFWDDAERAHQWDAFLKSIEAAAIPLRTAIEELAAYLVPRMIAARQTATTGPR